MYCIPCNTDKLLGIVLVAILVLTTSNGVIIPDDIAPANAPCRKYSGIILAFEKLSS